MRASDTDKLVRRLAREAALARTSMPLTRLLAFGCSVSLVAALTLCIAAFGSGIEAGHLLTDPWFALKLAAMGLLAAGAFKVLREVARPERQRVSVLPLLPACVLLLLAALLDPSVTSVGGRSAVSVPICLGAIIVLSLPGLALILGVLQSAAAVTRPRLAGGVAGLLSGALGGMAYAFACRNDGGLFVALWYGLAVGAVAGCGALIGRRVLAW